MMDEKIRLAIAERINEIMLELRIVNNDYDKKLKAIAETSGQRESMIDGLGDADRDVWEQYFIIKNQTEVTEQAHIYLQGIKDGYRLMMWILD